MVNNTEFLIQTAQITLADGSLASTIPCNRVCLCCTGAFERNFLGVTSDCVITTSRAVTNIEIKLEEVGEVCCI